MTPQKAKKLLAAFLEQNGLEYDKLAARTIDFSDLARAKSVFVEIHGWKPSPRAAEVEGFARANGFRVEFA